jgi:hypothetical protein
MMILTDARKAVEEEGLPWSMWDDFTGTCFPDAKVAGGSEIYSNNKDFN